MRYLFSFFFVLALIVGALFSAGFYILPPASEVARVVEINRAPSMVYPLLVNLRTFNEYSPWFERDPKADYVFSGTEEGAGQSARWSSSVNDLGDGVLTIVKAIDDKEVDTRIERDSGPIPFVPPVNAISKFVLTPTAQGTRVTWSAKAACPEEWQYVPCRYSNFISQLQLGGDFENGLLKLKAIAEKLPALDIADLNLERVNVAPQDFAFFEGEVPESADAFRAALHQAFAFVDTFFKANNIAPAGPPLAVTVKGADGKTSLRAGEPFSGPAPLAPFGVKVGKSPSGPALKVIYVGPYTGMAPTYAKLNAYARAHRLAARGNPWEVYVDDPDTVPPEQLRTEIYFPYQ